MNNFRALTLMELVIGMALVSLISISAVYTVDPGRRVRGTADTRRKNEITQMVRAFSIAKTDSLGEFPLLNDESEAVSVTLDDVENQNGCTGYSAVNFSIALNQYYAGQFTDPGGVAYAVQRLENGQALVCGVLSDGERFYRFE